jgi:predicted porin
MKKTMIALAALGAMAGAAHAQSSVTLYGLVDVYMGESTTKTQAGTTAKKGMSMSSGGLNGSRWGLRGAEDLGGGLKATFQLEAGFNVDDATPNNAAKSFDRTAKVGLSGGFGTVEFGRQYTRLFNMVDSYDAQGTDSFSSALGAIGGGVMGTSVRWDNSIVYSAPAMGGFSVSAQYAFGENGTPALSAGKSMGLLAGYASGPVSVHAVYESTKAIGGAASMKYTGIGGSYDFGMVKAFGQFLNQKDGVANGVRENAYVLGLSVPMGAGTFNAGFGNERQKTAGVKSGKTSSYGIEYRYDLSKRTTLYAGLSHVKETAVPAGTFTKDQMYGIGMRHKF